jgi:thioredoxin-related protein
MKTRTLSFLFISLLSSLFFAFNTPPLEELPLNSPIPMTDYKMKDITGKEVTLAEVKRDKGLLVIFSCNTCPYVKLSETRIKQYSDMCLDNNIGCVLVNSNEAQRAEEDSFNEMVKYHKEQKLRCCYAVDEKSRLANAFGASRTPQCFLFDGKGLVYRGAIDDNVKDATAAKSHYLKDAINAVIRGEKPKVQESKSIGCTIKRLES